MPLIPTSRKARARLMAVAIAAPVLALAVGLSLWAMRDAVVFFYGPAEAQANHVPAGRLVRLGGLVETGSVRHLPGGEVSFRVTDNKAVQEVRFRGDLPDLFREGQGVIAEGAFDEQRQFTAKRVLAKHDEKYMPREVADALKKNGEWRGDGAPNRSGQGQPVTAELGAFALALALALSVAQVGLSAAGRITRQPVLNRAGEGAALAAFAATAISFFALMAAFIGSDFSVGNVAMNSHTLKPLLYKVAGTWGSHEGSLLLWCLWMTGFGAAVAMFGRGMPAGLKAVSVAAQGGLGVLFLAFATFASNPFVRMDPVPIEGRSLNPLLQDPALAFHPPLLYGGYVGFSLIFAFAVAALIEGRVDAAWARWVRPWTLWAWSLLTVGIMLGAFWAYYELGWGGWWFWDPVENASFMPWLAGTALLHSAIVTEKRGALGGWTVFLALLAFSFSMLGGFLVRSGVLTSVHAFAVDPERGIMLLAIMGITAGAGFALFAWRAPTLAPGGLFAPVSREGTLVLNNLFLAVAAATVLLGTLYPLMLEAVSGQTISVGPPYFTLTFVPLMCAALLIVPAGPLMSWKRGDAKGVLQRLTLAMGLAILTALVVLALNDWKKAFGAAGVGLAVWVMAGAVAEVVERVRLFRAPGDESWRRLKGLPRGAWGTTLGHFGLGLFVLGACIETGWKVETAEVLPLGGSLSIGGYELKLEEAGVVEGPNYLAERGVVTATRGGRAACSAKPERRYFPAGGQTTTEVGLCFEGVSDLYVVFGERRMTAAGQPGWVVRAYWNPWARLIFLGPALMALGGLVSLSDRRLRLAPGRPNKAKAGEAA